MATKSKVLKIPEEKNQIEQMNIYEKILGVSMEIGNIEKNLKVGTGSYSYQAVSDLDVTLAVKKAEEKFRIVSIPIKQELISSESLKYLKKNGDEAYTYVDNIKMTVLIVNLDDTKEYVEVESFGKGLDSGDKGFGKASTYARKYALLNAYKIATGEDPDSGKSTEIVSPSTPSEKRVLIENYLEMNVNTRDKLLEHFGASNMKDLSERQINTVFVTYRQKGLI